MSTNIKITGIDTTPEIDPWHRAAGTLTTTWITINPSNGEVKITQEDDDNSTPEPVWNCRIIMRKLSGEMGDCVFDAGKIKNYLNGADARKLLNRIIDGHEIDWNGSNHVGSMTDDADSALNELVSELEDFSTNIEVWEVENYLCELVTATMTDAEINKIAKEIRDDKSVIVLGDPITFMRERRKEMQH